MSGSSFAGRVFQVAGIYGVLALFPMLFLEGTLAQLYPPAITHPELFYGFLGVALAWQVAFVIIGRDPVRFRPIMPAAVLEKAAFAAAVVVLFLLGRIPAELLGLGILDGGLGILFAIAYLQTPDHAPEYVVAGKKGN